MDVDKDGDIDYIDLALLFGFWFGGSLILILCYFVYDVCDRIGRKERNEKEMLDSIDNYVPLGDSDSEVEEITIALWSDLVGHVIIMNFKKFSYTV